MLCVLLCKVNFNLCVRIWIFLVTDFVGEWGDVVFGSLGMGIAFPVDGVMFGFEDDLGMF